MSTLAPALSQALAGCTVPPVPALIVRKYCVWNCAVYFLLVVGATTCEIAPLSLHFFQTYCTPDPPL